MVDSWLSNTLISTAKRAYRNTAKCLAAYHNANKSKPFLLDQLQMIAAAEDMW